jgi:hypothetical protein
LYYEVTVLAADYQAANSVTDGIFPAPDQTTGGEGPVAGQLVRIDICLAVAPEMDDNAIVHVHVDRNDSLVAGLIFIRKVGAKVMPIGRWKRRLSGNERTPSQQHATACQGRNLRGPRATSRSGPAAQLSRECHRPA